MGGIFTFEFPRLTVIVAGTTVVFPLADLCVGIIIMMAVVTLGKGDMIGMIKDHITAGCVKPDLGWKGGCPGEGIAYNADYGTGNQKDSREGFLGLFEHGNFLFRNEVLKTFESE